MNASSPTSRRRRPVAILLMVIVVAALVWLWWWVGNSEFMAKDACLDMGGRWNEGDFCEGARRAG